MCFISAAICDIKQATSDCVTLHVLPISVHMFLYDVYEEIEILTFGMFCYSPHQLFIFCRPVTGFENQPADFFKVE